MAALLLIFILQLACGGGAPPTRAGSPSATNEDAAAAPAPLLPASDELKQSVGALPSPDDLLAALGELDERSGVDKEAREGLPKRAPDTRIEKEEGPPPESDSRLLRALRERGLDRRAIESFLVTAFMESQLKKKLDVLYAPRIINGRIDDRYDPPVLEDLAGEAKLEYEAEVDASRSVAILIRATEGPSGQPLMPATRTLAERRNLCEGERFEEQPTVEPACSAVLVREDVLATAGHCAEIRPNWAVFDYRIDNVWKQGREIPPINAYRVSLQVSAVGQEDVALYRVDRPVKNRSPAKIREPGSGPYVSKGEYVFAAGYPDGLPLKVVLSGKVMRVHDRRLITNLDLFHGNSGSPVFSRARGRRELVGIVVDGLRDYVAKGSCDVVNHCLSGPSGSCTPDEAAVNAYLIGAALADLP